MDGEANKALVRRLVEGLNAGDPGIDDGHIAADFGHNRHAVGLAGVKAGHARTRRT